MSFSETAQPEEARAERRPSRGRLAPGPPGNVVFGSLPDFRRSSLQTLFDGWHQYGDVVRFRLGGTAQAYLLAHPDHVKHVLQENHRNYGKDPLSYNKLKPTVGEGLLTSEGEFWLRQRRLIQPSFHRQRVAALGTIMTESTLAMLERWNARVDGGQPLDVSAEMMRLTMDIVSKSMFGTDVSADANAVARAVTFAGAHTNQRMKTYFDLPDRLPLPGNRRFRAEIQTLDDIVYRMIGERRRSGQERGDLLAMLLDAHDEGSDQRMTDRQLRDEVMTVFIAGHETTSIALSWTWYLLSTHPEAARRLRSELASVLSGRPPTVDDLANLPYTKMVIEESMRLYPPAWVVARSPLVDDNVGGFWIPAGKSVWLSSYITHRHPAFWENPEGFDPERFLPERSENRPRYAYFPFGGGPRQCIGNGFAMQEAQLVLATVAQRYHLDLLPGHPIALDPLITLRPKYGIRMTLRKV